MENSCDETVIGILGGRGGFRKKIGRKCNSLICPDFNDNEETEKQKFERIYAILKQHILTVRQKGKSEPTDEKMLRPFIKTPEEYIHR